MLLLQDPRPSEAMSRVPADCIAFLFYYILKGAPRTHEVVSSMARGTRIDRNQKHCVLRQTL